MVAAVWVQRARAEALDEATIRELHRRMFSETWGWAGRYRTLDKTIGIHWPQIPVAIRNFVEDGRLWLREEVFPPDEAALRLHHRLVQIHPFPNGNGRHARLWTICYWAKSADLPSTGEGRSWTPLVSRGRPTSGRYGVPTKGIFNPFFLCS